MQSPKFMFTGFSGFQGTGDSVEELHVFTSDDGVSFEQVSVQFSVSRGTVRDPSPVRIGGRWVIAHTTIGFTKGAYFGLAESSDLRAWTPVGEVSLESIEGISVVWAPEWFVGDDGPHIFCTVSTDGGCTLSGSTFQMYELHPLAGADGQPDLSQWSEPRLITAADGHAFCTSAIDPYITKDGNTYILWYKNDKTGSVDVATSTSLLGPYENLLQGNWAGWQDDGAHLEGPCVVVIAPGHLRMYFDIFRNHYQYHGTHFSDSYDSGHTWTPIAPCVSPVLMRHGTVRFLGDIDADIKSVTPHVKSITLPPAEHPAG